MTAKWNLIVDVSSCTNCNLCVLACQDEYVDNSFPGYAEAMPKHGHNWIEIRRKERGQTPMIDVGYLPVMCQHCDAAPCIDAAENDAISKRDDGIVLIDPEKSKGQRQLVDACPYGAIWWNDEKDIPQHWIFDAHLLDDGWVEPRAVTVCATAAIQSVKLEDADMAKRAEAESLEIFRPEYGTKPRVWYKNLHRYRDAFIGGSVSVEIDGQVDCVIGAQIQLQKDGETLGEIETDDFGDFKFDKLTPDSGAYTIEISGPDEVQKKIEVELADSTYLGEIRL